MFTSFTLSQAGMSVRHIRLKEDGWRVGLAINATGAVVTGVVTVVIAITKFTHGAWAIMILVPVLVFLLVRLNHQYESEKEQLSEGALEAATAPVLRRHTVLVLLDHLDRSAARAMQYARTLRPDELRAVHIAADPERAEALMEEWHDLPLNKFPLELVACPDRRIARAALEVVAEEVADGRTEVTVLLPRREYKEFWHRFLHDRTSDSIAKALGGAAARQRDVRAVPPRVRPPRRGADTRAGRIVTVIESIRRRRSRRCGGATSSTIEGTIRSVRARPWGDGVATLECTVLDESGGIEVVFLGRRAIPGIVLGARIRARGRVGAHHRRLAILNPVYELARGSGLDCAVGAVGPADVGPAVTSAPGR